jgi:hypothetical protein
MGTVGEQDGRVPTATMMRLPSRIVLVSVNGAVVVAGEMQNGFAHGFGGNGAGIDACATDNGAGLDHGHAFLHFGSGNGGPLAGRTGTDDNKVILYGAHKRVFLRSCLPS